MTVSGVAGVIETLRVPTVTVLLSATACGLTASVPAPGCARTFAVVVTTGVPAVIERLRVPGRSVKLIVTD
jgi:hypothetical protein